MPHRVLNSAGGDMPHSGSNRGWYIERTNTEERGNLVDVNCGGICQTEARISVGCPNANIMGGGLRKYTGVTRIGRKWKARVYNKNNPDGKKNRIHLGTFRTAEMAAIAFDAAVLHLRGDSRANHLNFPYYSDGIKDILEGCSRSETAENIKYIAWKAAGELALLISVGNKDQGFEVPPLIGQQQKDQALEVSPAMPAATISPASASLMSSNIGMPDSISNADYTIVPMRVKQRIKVAARAAGSIRATKAEARQLRRKNDVDKQETVNPINHQIQHCQPGSDKSGMPDSVPNAGYTTVPVRLKQRIKVAARAAGSLRAANAKALQLRRKNHVDQPETLNPVNQQIQHGQPSSDKSGAADTTISSLLLIDEPLHHCSNLPNSAQNDINQQIQHGQPTNNTLDEADNNGVSSFWMVHESPHVSRNVAEKVEADKLEAVALPTSNTNFMQT